MDAEASQIQAMRDNKAMTQLVSNLNTGARMLRPNSAVINITSKGSSKRLGNQGRAFSGSKTSNASIRLPKKFSALVAKQNNDWDSNVVLPNHHVKRSSNDNEFDNTIGTFALDNEFNDRIADYATQ
jgi:hypothetical protein